MMATIQCPNRHFYDDSKHIHCPHCPVPGLSNVTRPAQAAPQTGWRLQPLPPTQPMADGAIGQGNINAPLPRTEAANIPTPALPGTQEAAFRPQVTAPAATVAMWQHKTGIDPVVGWLVCIKGVNKGRDYRLHSDRNQVGRAPNMEICIEQDETISRENHCQIVYDTRTRLFSLVPGLGRNLVYLNGKSVLGAIELAACDQIDIGEGSFRFVPFCGPDLFSWADAGGNAGARV